MWIVSDLGYYSIVKKPEDVGAGTLTVRARVASDLDNLRTKFLPELSPTQATPLADYQFRARAPQARVAQSVAAICNSINYNNVKSRVADVQGEVRAAKYHSVWAALARLAEPELPKRSSKTPIIYASIGDREDISLDPESPSVIAFSALRSREAKRYSTCGLERDIRDAYIACLERALISLANNDGV